MAKRTGCDRNVTACSVFKERSLNGKWLVKIPFLLNFPPDY